MSRQFRASLALTMLTAALGQAPRVQELQVPTTQSAGDPSKVDSLAEIVQKAREANRDSAAYRSQYIMGFLVLTSTGFVAVRAPGDSIIYRDDTKAATAAHIYFQPYRDKQRDLSLSPDEEHRFNISFVSPTNAVLTVEAINMTDGFIVSKRVEVAGPVKGQQQTIDQQDPNLRSIPHYIIQGKKADPNLPGSVDEPDLEEYRMGTIEAAVGRMTAGLRIANTATLADWGLADIDPANLKLRIPGIDEFFTNRTLDRSSISFEPVPFGNNEMKIPVVGDLFSGNPLPANVIRPVMPAFLVPAPLPPAAPKQRLPEKRIR